MRIFLFCTPVRPIQDFSHIYAVSCKISAPPSCMHVNINTQRIIPTCIALPRHCLASILFSDRLVLSGCCPGCCCVLSSGRSCLTEQVLQSGKGMVNHKKHQTR